MKQRVVDSVTIEASDLRTAEAGSWIAIDNAAGELQAIDDQGSVLEVYSGTLKPIKKSASVFQTCSECKKKIEKLYRVVRHEHLEVAFVKCACGQYPVVAMNGIIHGRLGTQFDSTAAYDGATDQGYNRSVWSTSTALLYCEKTSRLVVEYQWKDLEAGQFDKHSVKLSGMPSASKTADIVVEDDRISFLMNDGSLMIGGLLPEIYGKRN